MEEEDCEKKVCRILFIYLDRLSVMLHVRMTGVMCRESSRLSVEHVELETQHPSGGVEPFKQVR